MTSVQPFLEFYLTAPLSHTPSGFFDQPRRHVLPASAVNATASSTAGPGPIGARPAPISPLVPTPPPAPDLSTRLTSRRRQQSIDRKARGQRLRISTIDGSRGTSSTVGGSYRRSLAATALFALRCDRVAPTPCAHGLDPVLFLHHPTPGRGSSGARNTRCRTSGLCWSVVGSLGERRCRRRRGRNQAAMTTRSCAPQSCRELGQRTTGDAATAACEARRSDQARREISQGGYRGTWSERQPTRRNLQPPAQILAACMPGPRHHRTGGKFPEVSQNLTPSSAGGNRLIKEHLSRSDRRFLRACWGGYCARVCWFRKQRSR